MSSARPASPQLSAIHLHKREYHDGIYESIHQKYRDFDLELWPAVCTPDPQSRDKAGKLQDEQQPGNKEQQSGSTLKPNVSDNSHQSGNRYSDQECNNDALRSCHLRDVYFTLMRLAPDLDAAYQPEMVDTQLVTSFIGWASIAQRNRTDGTYSI
jgi:hypothetical protein